MSNARNLGELLEADGEVPSGKIDSVAASKLSGTIADARLSAARQVASLPLAGGTMTGNTRHGDAVYSLYGNSNDLQIYHSGNHSYIGDYGAGNLYIRGSNLALTAASGENYMFCLANSSVYIYHNNVYKLKTLDYGVHVYGNITIDGTVDGVDVAAAGALATNALPKTGGTLTSNLVMGATGNNPADITLQDHGHLYLGTGGDLDIYHDGFHSYIRGDGTGDLILTGSVIRLKSSGYEDMATFTENGAVTLLYDNATKLATTSTGIDVTGTVTADALKRGTPESSSGFASDTFAVTGLNTSNFATRHGAVFSSKHADSNILLCGVHDTAFKALVVKGSGNVGIGTASPDTELHVDHAGGGGLTLRSASNGGGNFARFTRISSGDTTNGDWALEHSSKALWFKTNTSGGSYASPSWSTSLKLMPDGKMVGREIMSLASGSNRWDNSGVWGNLGGTLAGPYNLANHPGGCLYLCEAAIQSLGGYTASMLVFKTYSSQYHVIQINNSSGEMRMSGSYVQYRQNSGADQTGTSGFQRITSVMGTL